MCGIPYATICVAGADAESFLQGQLTVDVGSLQGGERGPAAWCNPKGRVIFVATLWRDDDEFRLSLPAELAEHVVQRMTMFRFRAKVDFASRPATAADLGIGDDTGAWQLARLRAGIAEIYGPQSEQFTAHMLNLDRRGAISLDKGCYTGQEIIARTHYRGATRRRLHRYESTAPAAPGDKITLGERAVGEVVNSIGNDLLAVVPDDKADAGLAVAGAALRHVPLSYPDAGAA